MSPKDTNLELLRRVPLFEELSEEELERIAAVAVPRSFPKGVRVFHEGDTERRLLHRPHRRPAGDARALRRPRDRAGDARHGRHLRRARDARRRARSASVETLNDSELLALPASDVRRLLSDHPEIAVKLIVALTRRLRETNERVARQSFQTVPSRVAGVLRQLVAEDALPEGRDGITMRMTQADLAQLAGTSRESVSRFLATLERAGVVVVGRGRVTVVEPRRLRAYIF